MPFPLGVLARQQGDLLGVLPGPDEVETEVGLKPLLLKIQRHERPANAMGKNGANYRVNECRPDQVARNAELHAPKVQRRLRRKGPQNDDKRAQRDHGSQEPDADRDGAVNEQLHVLGDALVGVVRGITKQLHAVVVGVIEPRMKVARREPAPPPDPQPLVQINLIDRQDDVGGRQTTNTSSSWTKPSQSRSWTAL